MGTITRRRRADGNIAYRAQVRIARNGALVSESSTFTKLALAKSWVRQREGELEEPDALRKATSRRVTIGDLIKCYRREYKPIREWGRTKANHLKQLEGMDLAKLDATRLTSQQLVDHVLTRREQGAGGSTVGNDLIWLSVVFKLARPAWGFNVDPYVIDEARRVCSAQQLIHKSRRRTRRPTTEELNRLTDYFSRRDRRAKLPMVDIMWFAIHSARRQGEITRIRWADNDKEHLIGVVRDAKHPRHKMGNHREFKYTPEAWAIVERQPKTEECIFPYKSKTISANFTHACHVLEIEDLRFHDLRHEATSRLFEAGYSITEVSQFTLHESWQELKRYTNLSPKKLKHREI